MKLSKEQISAVAQEIATNHNKKRLEELKVIKESPEVIELANHYFELANAIPQEHRLHVSSGSVQMFLDKIANTKATITYLQPSEISRKVTLATIETNSLDELMEKLKDLK